MSLTGKQRKYLRGLGHSLKPVVQLGKGGLSEGVVNQADVALEDHELIKLRFAGGFDDDRDDALQTLAERLGAELAGTIGHTALLYRARDEDPEIRLP